MASRDLKGLTIEIGGDVSNLTSALSSVDRELSNLQSNLRTVNSALRLDPGNVDALAQRQELLNEAVQTTTQRLETLREAQRQADEQIANGVEVDEQAYRNLRSEIIRAEASLNDYQRQANESGDTSREAADEAAEGWTVVKDVIADLASQAVQAAIDAFKDLMFESEKAFDLLQAKIGASDEAMRKYGDVARDVFKNGWGESLADVSEAIGTITNMLGDLDQTELTNVTENAMTLRDVFGWDIQESVRAANSLMDQFGLTSDEAFNLMVQGAQKGLDQNGDLLDTINEYSVQFSDAGYSANDMFNMLANGAKTGTWSVDKLGDAVKEYNVRMSDGTVIEYINKNAEALGLTAKQAEDLGKKMLESGGSSKEAMTAILNGILSIEDPTERYKAGVGAFGTMWEDLGEEAVKALFDTEGGIKSTNQAMGQVKTDAYDNLATSVTTLGRTLKDELLQPIIDLIAPAIKGLVDWMIENMDIVKPIILGLATAFGVLAGALAISGIISAVQKAMALLNATLLANPITLIVAAIAGLVAAFLYLWNNCEAFRNFWLGLWENIKKVVSAAWEAISGFFSAAWDIIKGIWNGAASFFSGVWEGIKGAFSNVGSWFSETFKAARNGVERAWDGIQNYFAGVWNGIKGAFASVGSWFSETFTKAKEGVKTVWAEAQPYFEKTWDGIKNTYSEVDSYLSNSCFAPAWEHIKKIWSVVADHFRTIWESIKTTFSVVKSVLTGDFQGAWDGIKSIVGTWKSYFSNIWSQIKNIFTSVPTWFSNTFSNAWTAVKNVFSNWGSFFGGLWNTIKNKFSSIGTNIANAISGAVKSGINGVISRIENTINSAVRLINGAINLINKIPGVSVGKVGEVNFPRLARGGVVYGPTLAEIGEYPGAAQNPEIVTPQNILRETFDESLAKFAVRGLNASDSTTQANTQRLAMQINELTALVKAYLPEIASKTTKNIYLDKNRLVGELASDMDEALGEIANRRAVGAI